MTREVRPSAARWRRLLRRGLAWCVVTALLQGLRDVQAGNASPEHWENAGGEFGLSADWREAVSIPSLDGGEPMIRGGTCMEQDMQDRVREILDRRNKTSADQKVAACLRSKNYGRFLPEWIAFHYVVGVDYVTLFDDFSEDKTARYLQPFEDAGMVEYKLKKLSYKKEMEPLRECLASYRERRLANENDAPRWLLFHDADEFLFPADTNLTVSQALHNHAAKCCTQVPRVQYGTGGHVETPRGLMLENYLTHARPTSGRQNRLPKLVANLAPTSPELGVIEEHIPSMHNAHGCHCDLVKHTEMRINHYLGSKGDYLDHTRHFWQDFYSEERVEEIVRTRDVNDRTSDEITYWACATREILYRIANGLDIATGLAQPDSRAR